MIPILYNNFSSLSTVGFIGYLTNCTKCDVTEVLNGEFVLNLETDINEKNQDQILTGKTIRVEVGGGKVWQYFLIEEVKRKVDGKIIVTANHIKNLAFSTAVSAWDSGEGTPTEIFNNFGISLPHGFTFSSNITQKKTFYPSDEEIRKLGDILGGNRNSFLSFFTGEYNFDNTSIEFLSRRGKNTNFVVQYGKNISTATQTESSEFLFSHIIPVGNVFDSFTGRNILISSATEIELPNSESQYHKTAKIDCTELTENMTVNSHTGENYQNVYQKMNEFAIETAVKKGYNKRRISISVDVEDALKEMQNLNLGDTVYVNLSKFGTLATARVVKTVYDVIGEKYKKIDIGSPKILLSNILSAR